MMISMPHLSLVDLVFSLNHFVMMAFFQVLVSFWVTLSLVFSLISVSLLNLLSLGLSSANDTVDLARKYHQMLRG